MKVIIIEGPDNCGKDTLISKILEYFPTTTLIHCSKPISKKYSSIEQDLLFETYVNNVCEKKYNTHLILFNRGFHGEFVYGQLYRKRTESEINKMIYNLENKFVEKNIDIKYIQLLSSNIQLLVKNEDGKSLSSGNIKKIELECELFKKVFNNSILNKKLIYINKDNEFRSRESILNEVMSFIKN